MSTLAVVLVVLAVVLLAFAAAGFAAVRRRDRQRAGVYARHVAEADHALQEARAADRGWDRAVMEQAARSALEQDRPGWRYDDLHLVLVEDRPGTEEDRAHFVAVGGDEEAQVILARQGDHWRAERVE